MTFKPIPTLSHSSSSTSVFIAKHGVIRYIIFLWPIWVHCPSCVTPQSLTTPTLLMLWRAEWEEEKDLTLRKLCSALLKALMCFHRSLISKCRTQHLRDCYVKSSLHPSQTQYRVTTLSQSVLEQVLQLFCVMQKSYHTM